MPDTTLGATTLIDRTLIRVSGAEARPFLQGLVTQDILGLEEGRPRWSGLLTPQGKALFDFLLWADGDDVLIDCAADEADALAKRLTLYRLRRAVMIARDDSLAVHWASSPERGGPDPRLPALGHRWLAPAGEPASGWRAHRLALNVLEGAAEIGDTLWLECNAEELHGVAYDKGCYIGQENTARMHYRNKLNRRLVVVPIAQADPKRQKLALPELGLSIELRRVEDMAGLTLPAWLAEAAASEGAAA
jgi:hypothetical protein